MRSVRDRVRRRRRGGSGLTACRGGAVVVMAFPSVADRPPRWWRRAVITRGECPRADRRRPTSGRSARASRLDNAHDRIMTRDVQQTDDGERQWWFRHDEEEPVIGVPTVNAAPVP